MRYGEGPSIAPSDELHREAAERAEIGMDGVALIGPDRADERARQHGLAGGKLDVVAAEAICEPGDAERGMAHHAERETGFLDIGIAVERAAAPAQIDVGTSER